MMNGLADTTLEQIRVREVAGVFRSREKLDAAVYDLLFAGFDRADVDLMAGYDALRDKLGEVYVPAEELADLPDAPRRAFIARDEARGALAAAAGLLGSIGALAGGLIVVASGGALALGLIVAVAGGVTGSTLGLLARNFLDHEQAEELETQLATGGLVLWVRVRTPEQEANAQEILRAHGAEAVRVHEIPLAKRLEDVPLHRLIAGEPRS
jgi:hypothetical protein